MSTPRVSYTDELHAALVEVDRRRESIIGSGVSPEEVAGLIEAVRRMDAELVAARHVHRNSEFYPYFPESYQAEEDGLEDAERLLRTSMPEVRSESGAR